MSERCHQNEKPGSLRRQIVDIGYHWFLREYVNAIGFPALVKELAIQAFLRREGESAETRAIRKALRLTWVTEDEPAVE